MTATTNTTDVTVLVTGLLQLGVDIAKSSKAKTGMQGTIKLVLADPVVLASLEQVAMNIANLPGEFKALKLADLLALLSPVVTGVEAIYAAAA